MADTITTVVLEHNSFTALSDVSSLTELPALASLYLGHNQIRAIGSRPSDVRRERPLQFSQSLKHVDLSYNSIGDWSFINKLSSIFPGLKNLRANHNLLYEGGPGRTAMGVEEGFMLTVARLPKLKTLNYSTVRDPKRSTEPGWLT